MAVLFFDTSALVRRYDVGEPGGARVRALCRRDAGHALLIARLTSVEVASALQRKVRSGDLNVAEQARIWRLFREHVRRQYRIAELDMRVTAHAEHLIATHPLRAYDAVQVATALTAASLIASLGVEFRFCTADRSQASVASAEGLLVDVVT